MRVALFTHLKLRLTFYMQQREDQMRRKPQGRGRDQAIKNCFTRIEIAEQIEGPAAYQFRSNEPRDRAEAEFGSSKSNYQIYLSLG